jgi:ectoine hydroxylase-related dioxygenase (phytanoyl-CoA dioxygenase family)
VTADTTESLAERLRVNGFILLENVIPLDLVRQAREAYQVLLDEARQRPANRGKGRYDVAIPFKQPFSNSQLYANETAVAIIQRILGSDCGAGVYGSGTNLPGTDYQPVHQDGSGDLYPETPGAPLAPYQLWLNIPLVNVTEELGPMELWPGTHWVPNPQMLEQVASGMRSYKALMPEGSVLIRDPRTWHRGTPNRSSQTRAIVGIAYTRPWFRHYNSKPISIPAATWETMSEREQRLMRFNPIVK